MQVLNDLKDVPAGAAMLIVQPDGTYLCVLREERPEAPADVGSPVLQELN